MDQTHKFRVVAWWSSGRTGIAKADSATNAIHFTAPVCFGGIDGRWTPEDLLLGAIASCFTTMFCAIADRASFEYVDLQLEVSATLARSDSEYGLSGILVRSNLTVANPENQPQGVKLLQHPEALCLVKRALAIQHTFEHTVTVRALACRMNGTCAVPEALTKQLAAEPVSK